MKQETDEAIIKYSKELRMPVFRSDFKSLAKQAAIDRIDYEEFLLQLMEREFEVRAENRKKSQIRQAGFPAKMYLNELNRDQLPQDAIEKLPMLERLDFIESGQNIVLAGNPGTGKTHIAVGLHEILGAGRIFDNLTATIISNRNYLVKGYCWKCPDFGSHHCQISSCHK